MQKIIEKSGLILALALICQVNAQFSGSLGGTVPGGRPGPAGAEIGLQYDVPSGAENGAYGPGGYQGYGGSNDPPVGSQGGNGRPIFPGNRPPGWIGGYYPGDSSQGWNGGYYPGGRPPMGLGRPGRRPGFRPPGWYNNYNPGDGPQVGFNVGGRPAVGFGRPGRRPVLRPPVGPGWSNGYYPGNNFPGGYFPGDKPQEGFLVNGIFYPVNKPQNENNKPVTEEKPTQGETIDQAEERPPQNDPEQGSVPADETDDLPVFQAGTEVGSAVNVNAL